MRIFVTQSGTKYLVHGDRCVAVWERYGRRQRGHQAEGRKFVGAGYRQGSSLLLRPPDTPIVGLSVGFDERDYDAPDTEEPRLIITNAISRVIEVDDGKLATALAMETFDQRTLAA